MELAASEIPTTSCLVWNGGVSKHLELVNYSKVTHWGSLVPLVWGLGWVFGFTCVLVSCLSGPLGAFLVGMAGGGCLADWVGFTSCECPDSEFPLGLAAVLRSLGLLVTLESLVAGSVDIVSVSLVWGGTVVWCLVFVGIPLASLPRCCLSLFSAHSLERSLQRRWCALNMTC